ncbi:MULTISPECIES: glycosyltransferase [unclassified Mesorhizobium]|uniref:glycosyltransferase n=1 Tax=unclassified Mesorhizobium TaxID=325217 RepID=UPI0013E06110|nr:MULTISPECIES: glycosyltransferase [unclassified Mesorhizobium]
MQSFVRWGHEFHLWVYDDLQTPVVKGVVLRDACEVLPRKRIFRKRARDIEAGVGEGSVSPFSDLFRYKLLHDHGGVWSDMDITCLRPFDFTEDYVFRPHQLGMVGNLMKCPKGSELMKSCYEESDSIANEDVDWHAQIRVLNRNVERLGLTSYIRKDISNLDSWHHAVRHFVESATPIPDNWYAIHWLNEFQQTLRRDDGVYRGQKLSETPVDTNRPPAGSTLHELYRYYGLIDPYERYTPLSNAGGDQKKIGRHIDLRMRPSETQLNILLPSLVRGGAERTVIECVQSTFVQKSVATCLYTMSPAQKGYAITPHDNLVVHVLDYLSTERAARKIALEVANSPTPLLYAHSVPLNFLKSIWALGVATVPVVHTTSGEWIDAPVCYNHPLVPFVVATADIVADQLRRAGCIRPIVTLRHEIQRSFSPEDLARRRIELRNAYGLAPDTLLVGMVGRFSPGKAYTRAVRVLAQLQRIRKAKLMILGDWDHPDGMGRAAYEATCRLALELGVIADMIMPGNVHPVDPYYAAFDVFMNTSVFEASSIALMEATRAGCPVVAADVGGNRAIVPADAVLVEEPSDINAYVTGLLDRAQRQKRWLPSPPIDPDIIPRLWTLLAQYAVRSPSSRSIAEGTLFVTQNLNIGGPARSLTLLLTSLPTSIKTALCVIDGISIARFRAALTDAQVPILDLKQVSGLGEITASLLQWFDQLTMRSICFWNVQPEIKLLLAKVLFERDVRFIDVSPGPMLFDELADAARFQRRIMFTADDYFKRLDDFVALYAGGAPSPVAPRRVSFIPLGTAPPPRFVPLPEPADLLPGTFDPTLAIGTVCRIVPDKRIEFLIEMMRHVNMTLPGASLTIVGGPDSRTETYWRDLLDRQRREKLDYIRFVGPREDVTPFLGQFRVFVMVSDRQGCPNASLEAMAMGLPVVANPDGGTAEQVDDGVTGYLASTSQAMADRVIELLENPKMLRKFGEEGRARVAQKFSVEKMVARYMTLLRYESELPAS